VLLHRREVARNAAADAQIFELNMGGAELRRQRAARTLSARARSLLRRAFPRTAQWLRQAVRPAP
jgi:hypothetical protein